MQGSCVVASGTHRSRGIIAVFGSMLNGEVMEEKPIVNRLME